MTSRQRINISVIIDCSDEDEGRLCFWRDCANQIKEQNVDFNFRFVSLSENVEKGVNPIPMTFDYRETQVVIVDWDVLNGDPLYGSDRAFQIFRHFLEEIDLWVKAGGILLVECQEGSRTLLQEVYDLFGAMLGYPLIVKEKREFHHQVHIHKHLKNHPILRGIDIDEYTLPNILEQKRPLYPPKKTSDNMHTAEENARWARKIFLGWFDKKKTHRDWEILLFAKSREFGGEGPVMMCRTASGSGSSVGAYIVTSMFLGSCNWITLLRNILTFGGNPARDAFSLYGKRRQAEKKKRFFRVALLIVGIALLSIVGWIYPSQIGPLLGAALTGIGAYLYALFRRRLDRLEPKDKARS